MSRCFPFPPPGYEKKAIVCDTDLLTKEKHKEKKHRKDKDDKQKREGKDKKSKERSKEKHREKKDRKEKHKDKDRNRDKGKNRTPDEKKIEGQPGYYNGDKLGPNILQTAETKDTKYVQELARRLNCEDKAAGIQIAQRISFTDKRNFEKHEILFDNRTSNQPAAKEKEKKVDGQTNHIKATGQQNASIREYIGMAEKEFEGIPKTMEKKDVGKHMEGKEKNNHKKNDGKGDKHRSRDQEKKRKSKDKDRDKEKKKEEKAREINEPRNELLNLRESSSELKESGKDSIYTSITKPLELLKASSKNSADQGNLGKRKECMINGFLHDNDVRPNKLPRPVSSTHPVVENGKKLENCQRGVQFASELQRAANSCKVDVKEERVHGLVGFEQPNVCTTGPPPCTVQVNENDGTPARPPHPDVKYLDGILSVPKMGWVDVDDQGWLFSSKYVQPKKSSVISPWVDRASQVWAEALWIESADVSALPYVVPY